MHTDRSWQVLGAAIAMGVACAFANFSPARAQSFLGLHNVPVVLDADFPDDHRDLINSHYPSERDRAVKAGQLAAAEIMVLDEVLQAAQDDAACRNHFPRGTSEYRACTAELYALPPLLERLAVDRDCPISLNIPDRVACLLLVETTIRARRHAMQTHTTWQKRLFALDSKLGAHWLKDSGPPAAAWGRYPEAGEIAGLDSLLIHVHATNIATAIQAAELYEEILASADEYVLRERTQQIFVDQARATRRVEVINARNRFMSPWLSRPGISLAHPSNPAWLREYAAWLSAVRFGTGKAGMLHAGPEAFDIRPPEAVPLPEGIPYDTASPREASSDSQPAGVRVTRRQQPVIWVRGGVPIRIPPTEVPAAARNQEIRLPAPADRASNLDSGGAASSEQSELELKAEEWPEILLPRSVAECRIRWEPFTCERTTEADVVAYAAEKVNETLGTPTFIASAAPKEAVRTLAKRISLVGALVESAAHFRARRPVEGLAALFELYPGMAFNPNFKRDIARWQKLYESARQQAIARQRIGDGLIAGHREFERHVLGTREMRAMPDFEKNPRE